MTRIKCLIVDDESIAQRIISNYLHDLNDFEIIATCFNAMEAMAVLEKEQIDLMFLDIEMPKLKGLAFLRTLRVPPAVIITTAHREFALEGFELDVVDYLLKPIPFERFIKAINKYKSKALKPSNVPQENVPNSTQTLYVKSDRKTFKLDMIDIQYIEGMNNYILIHLADRKHVVYSSLTDILEELSDQFLRVHKSFVVNKSNVISFSKEAIDLRRISIPIGKTYRDVIDKL